MERYVCIHGHFYQPPRENPWLEAIELQDSAYPYHDWNERITAEAYGPNARSRILDDEQYIVEIVNNYARMSFNVGPTLLAWLEEASPDIYQAILDADRESTERFSGHGSAISQAYGHLIMPLSNSRDKETQVLWGVRDFEHRFGRAPEGMWLPETAVDIDSLEALAKHGIQFTILEPGQAARVRRLGGRNWKDVSGGRIDPTRAYTVPLPSGRTIDAFFYDGPISRAVAFEALLRSGEAFAERLASGFSDERTWPQIVNIATDGESYGHHHRHGDMALAYALKHIESAGLARLTNYAEYLERHPPDHHVEIVQNTSWSCAHGVERWRSDCGCETGGQPGWNQAWRAPLREALDWLRDRVAPTYEEQAAPLLPDPWAARDAYIQVILDRSQESQDRFFAENAGRELDREERMRALKLLELQRHAMLMFTSCGWFFNELSGIETTQVLQYAGRVIQLSQDLVGDGLEEEFLRRLEKAKSNIPDHKDGATVYRKFVQPAVVDLVKVGAHFAVSSLFEPYPEELRLYCYDTRVEDYQALEAGLAKLAVGRLELTSAITQESERIGFAALHFGDHNITAGAHSFHGETYYDALKQEATDAFSRGDLPEAIRVLDRHFGDLTYSLKTLFKDEQRKVLDLILESSLAEAEASYRAVFEHHAPLMRFLADIRSPLPPAFADAARLVVNANLRRALEDEPADAERVRALLEEARFWNVEIDEVPLSYSLGLALERLADSFAEDPADLERLQLLASAVDAAAVLPFGVDLSHPQNRYYEVLRHSYRELRLAQEEGDGGEDWNRRFLELGTALRMRVE